MLRQQLRVLRRTAGRPKLTARDRVLLAPPAACSPASGGRRRSSPPDAAALTATSCDERGAIARDARRADHRSTPRSRNAACGWRGRARDGLRQDLRSAPQARHPGGRHHDRDHAATTRPQPGATTLRAHLGAVPASPGRGDRRLRLPARWRRSGSRRCRCCRSSSSAADGASLPASRPTLTRRGPPSRPATPAGILPSGARRSGCCCATTTPSSPGPRRSSVARARKSANPNPGSKSERRCCAVGPNRPHGVSGLDAGARPAPAGAAVASRRPTRQPAAAAPRRRAGLALAVPDRREQGSMPVRRPDVKRRDVLGGLIHQDHAVAA